MKIFNSMQVGFISFAICIFVSLLLIQSCKKEPSQVTQNQLTSVSIEEIIDKVTCQNGVLIFPTQKEFSLVNEWLNSKTHSEKLKFGENLNFTSQSQLIYQIIDEEEKSFEQFNQPFKDLPLIEIKEKQKSWKHTNAYLSAFENGLLEVFEDSDTSNIYSLSLCDPTIASVLNIDGLVLVGDTLFQYTNETIKVCFKGGLNSLDLLKSTKSSSPLEKIFVLYDKSSVKERGPNDYNWDGNLSKGWDYSGGGGRRGKFLRKGFSHLEQNSCNNLMTCKFLLECHAQKHSFGSWKYSNTFMPMFIFNGSWGGDAGFVLCSNWNAPGILVLLSNLTLPFGATQTPMVNREFSHNNGSFSLHPHSEGFWPSPNGNYPPTGSKEWSDAIDIYNISINGNIENGYINLTGG
jgi:hypothetical protein